MQPNSRASSCSSHFCSLSICFIKSLKINGSHHVLSAYVLPEIRAGVYKKVIFVASGAMMSPDMIKQGESIPAIGHLLVFEG